MKAHLILASFGLAALLAGCAPVASKPAPHRHLPPISATTQGAQHAPGITAVQFLGAQDGWFGVDALGSGASPLPGSARLFRTKDGGRTWTEAAAFSQPILAIDFLSAQAGFALAGSADGLTLYRTADGGETFTKVSTPPGGANDPELRFASPVQGFVAAGDSLDVTSDGGKTWERHAMALPQLVPQPGSAQATPYFRSPSDGFLAENGAVYRSRDEGATWQQVYRLPAVTRKQGEGAMTGAGPIAFATATRGYAALDLGCWAGGCADVILRSEDAGATWRPVSFETQAPLPGIDAPSSGPPGSIRSLVAWGDAHVVAATMNGIAQSQDGGATWSVGRDLWSMGTYSLLFYDPAAGLLAVGGSYLAQLTPQGAARIDWPAPSPNAQVEFFDARRGLGLESGPLTQLLRSDDGGRTWRRAPGFPIPYAFGIAFASRQDGWVEGATAESAPEVIATRDGGRDWRVVKSAYPRGAQLFPGGKGVLLAQPGDLQGPPALYLTTDGGQSFTRRALPKDFARDTQVAFPSPSVGFAASSAGVFRTTDGGRTWHALKLPKAFDFPTSILAISADPKGDLWLLTQVRSQPSQTIWIRRQGGSWQEIDMPPGAGGVYAQSPLDAISSRTAWLLTWAGLLRSTDGGRTWRNLTWPRQF